MEGGREGEAKRWGKEEDRVVNKCQNAGKVSEHYYNY